MPRTALALRAFGVLYGCIGLVSIIPLEGDIVEAARKGADARELFQLAIRGAFIFYDGAMMYGFLKLKRWGRLLGVTSGIVLFLVEVISLPWKLSEYGLQAVIRFSVAIMVYVCLLVICLAPTVRKVMTR